MYKPHSWLFHSRSSAGRSGSMAGGALLEPRPHYDPDSVDTGSPTRYEMDLEALVKETRAAILQIAASHGARNNVRMFVPLWSYIDRQKRLSCIQPFGKLADHIHIGIAEALRFLPND